MNSSFLLPEVASTSAQRVDEPFYFVLWVALFFFFAVMICCALFVWRYHHRRNKKAALHVTHNTTLEVIWTLIPLALLVVIAVMGYRGYLDLSIPPHNAMTLNLTAQKWQWTLSYPNTSVEVSSVLKPELGNRRLPFVVPVNRPIVLVMNSTDVLHSFFVPAFRIKQDVLPGRYTKIWFTPIKIGSYPIKCAEYCGTNHSGMLAEIQVVSEEDFQRWLHNENAKSIAENNKVVPPEVRGKRIFEGKGACMACHAVASKDKQPAPEIGPRLFQVFGRTEQVYIPATNTKTSVKVDENYLRESIEDPNAKQVVGFAPQMPTFKGVLSDAEINDLIAYIKTLK